MKDQSKTTKQAPTLQELIKRLGKGNTVVKDTQKILQANGHECTDSAIYATIYKNGSNNADIEAAILAAIKAAQERRKAATDQRKALAAA